MTAAVTLKDTGTGTSDEVLIENIEDRNCFTYTDNESCNCELCIYEDGLCLFRQCEDHLLELHLKDDAYASVTTEEGVLRFVAKIVDFQNYNDILVMRYIVNDEAKTIEIRYY
jgi:hypothetical protein